MLVVACVTADAQQKEPVFKNERYSLYADCIKQDSYVAKALSRTHIVSDYKSPANQFQSADMSFKFSINGKDNEMLSGVDHHLACVATNGVYETPLIKFGTTQYDGYVPSNAYMAPDTKLKVRLDMRDVLDAFAKNGYYKTFNGEKIYREDFKGVYIAGSAAPLTWDFDNLVHYPHLQLHDEDKDGIYETTLLLNAHDEKIETATSWTLTKNIDEFPQYQSPHVMADALYNLSLEEMLNAVEADSTFRTGKEWAGVWTRDISYSIILSMAYLQPKVAYNSLMRKVSNKKKIIQDTGTGGAWPVSTDRMIWAIAAWELYVATGDANWLKEAQQIIKNSIDDDLKNVYDNKTGLVKGESSFLDWREQTYPSWMQPADIFESKTLGTNAVHYKANIVLSKMSELTGDHATVAKHKKIAEKIKAGINTYLWQADKKYYGQYLYGRNYNTLSTRSEALGEALCVLFDIADNNKQKQIIENTPQTAFGVPCIFPYIPNTPPYHNNAVWPFVQAYWMLASAKAGNEKSVMESISSIYRAAALFVTNKENFVADNGDFLGTQINSSNMLWSLSGSIALVHKVIFGLQFSEAGILFKPFVPQALKGNRRLANFKYRNAILNIEMSGYGNVISSIKLDGKELKDAKIPSNIFGVHQVKIVLANKPFGNSSINKVESYTSLPAPVVKYNNEELAWIPVKNAVGYNVIKNGKLLKSIADTNVSALSTGFGEYQVVAVDKNRVASFASEPVVVAAPENVFVYETEEFVNKSAYAYKDYSQDGFIETSSTINTKIEIPIQVNTTGNYFIDCRYANGNGPVNTENKCAVRTLVIDNNDKGIFVFPQRGKGEWSSWGYTNSLEVYLTKGAHKLVIEYKPANENMNMEVNQAMIDYIRLRLEI